MTERKFNDPYYIEFKTQEIPGKIVATKVILDSEIIAEMNKPFNIALCEHPLYHHLVDYCRRNPPRAPTKETVDA